MELKNEWVTIATAPLDKVKEIAQIDNNLRRSISIYDEGIYWVDPYLQGDIKRQSFEKLNINNPRKCPHCGSNHASLMKENKDYYCFFCGWRDAEYFNNRFNEFIKWVETREMKYGKPVLSDNQRERHLNLKREYYYNHREDIIKKQKEYNKENYNKVRERKHKWYMEHGKEVQRIKDGYYERNKLDK